MVERYKTYQFRISDERRAGDDLKFATADRMMGFLEEICQGGVQLKREINDLPLVGGVEALYLIGNAVVRNKTSGVAPYCETEIICQGKPTNDIVQKYSDFYRSDPFLIHF